MHQHRLTYRRVPVFRSTGKGRVHCCSGLAGKGVFRYRCQELASSVTTPTSHASSWLKTPHSPQTTNRDRRTWLDLRAGSRTAVSGSYSQCVLSQRLSCTEAEAAWEGELRHRCLPVTRCGLLGSVVETSGNEGSRLAGHLWYWEQRRGSET